MAFLDVIRIAGSYRIHYWASKASTLSCHDILDFRYICYTQTWNLLNPRIALLIPKILGLLYHTTLNSMTKVSDHTYHVPGIYWPHYIRHIGEIVHDPIIMHSVMVLTPSPRWCNRCLHGRCLLSDRQFSESLSFLLLTTSCPEVLFSLMSYRWSFSSFTFTSPYR